MHGARVFVVVVSVGGNSLRLPSIHARNSFRQLNTVAQSKGIFTFIFKFNMKYADYNHHAKCFYLSFILMGLCLQKSLQRNINFHHHHHLHSWFNVNSNFTSQFRIKTRNIRYIIAYHHFVFDQLIETRKEIIECD